MNVPKRQAVALFIGLLLFSSAAGQDRVIAVRAGQPAQFNGDLYPRQMAREVVRRLTEHRSLTEELRLRSIQASASTSRAEAAERIAELEHARYLDAEAGRAKAERWAKGERKRNVFQRLINIVLSVALIVK